MIGAMGANHTEHDKLVNIVNIIEASGKAPYDGGKELDRVQTLYNSRIAFMYNRVPYVAEEKFDGFSYLCDGGHMLSKSLSTKKGHEGEIVDKSGHMPQISRMMRAFHDILGINIHGEVYIPGGTSDDVTGILGCGQDEALRRQDDESRKLHYMWVDIRGYDGKNITHEPYYVRRALLEHIYNTYVRDKYDEYIHLAPITMQPIMAFHDIIANGGEGLIIKDTSRPYVPGKKPAGTWIKAKKEITLDVAIIGLNDGGSGKNKELFKSLAIGLMIDGKLVHAGDVHSGISDQLRKDIYDDPSKYIGRVIECDAMEYNGKHVSLRHARLVRFRDDKTREQCTPDGIKVKVDLI